ncbi:glyoxalase family protein [Pyrenophora tritici-repentis]|nr:glyoxalase family protein [Pyrenophora tritici-repentis]KAI0587460.1 glyoxalase family protein [Pyrenophora tritici-repentis]KAI0611972.1 glyoxalase family protein [Pyrenophora tritici-repentis]KAI0624140.1 glyoxalase family protein [Pyrenophora tritici-repentis]PZD27901.1 Glyoxalase-2 multi-domain protein [Pyrenophora tritici-repentis]
MPVSHIGLTVSHLPTSTSFFLSALQPLGYRYIGETGNQIGLGINDADFFLCQETPGVKAGAAHIAFTAPSTTAVRNFYAAALTAGGRPNGAPGSRCSENGHFNAAVLDFDGNSIEVVYRNGPDMRHDGTIIEHSRVITWSRTVTHSSSYYESRSSTSSSSSASPIMTPQTESVASKAPSVARSVSAPTVVPVPEPQSNSNNGSGAQHLLGTLLGAAAGAAVAYAFVRSEQDSARKEADFSAFMDAKNAAPDPQPVAVQPVEIKALPSPPSVHRNDDDARSAYSSAPSRASQVPRTSVPRQIEAAPASYYSPSEFGAPTPMNELLAIEYAPAYSRAPSAAPSRMSSAHRSHTSPELLTIEKARSSVSTARPAESIASTAKPPRPTSSKPQSVVSKAHSTAPSAVPSTLISSFVADRPEHEDESSVQSYHSARTKARSSHSSVSKHSSRREGRDDSNSSSSRKEGRSSSPTESKAPPPKPPKPASKAASIVSSILGRNKSKDHEEEDDFIDDLDLDDFTEDDLDTVVPSDSISQIGDPSTRRRHRSHRHKSKKHDDGESTVSHRSKKEKSADDNESSVSKSSKHSHRSERSERSHRSHRSHRNDSADDEDSSRPHRSSRSSKSSKPSLVSESSEASTIRPSGKKTSRKDSLTQGQYDGLFDEVQYGTGGVHASRQVTPSMASAARKNPMRSMINFSHAQKVRNFEGSQAGLARD